MKNLSQVQKRIHEAALRLFVERGGSQLNISDLAAAAGVARGTIYNNLESMEQLFVQVATHLGAEMHQRVTRSFAQLPDPAQRLSNGIRFFVRRTHEEPHWGAFINRFALSNASLQEMLYGPPTMDLMQGLSSGRYNFRPEQLMTVISHIAGTTLGAMFLVSQGHKTWREAGSDSAEMVLRSLGISFDEARAIATVELPPLPTLD
ncbi:TetR/AcrR family transcriptional regulator [Pseudomonas sp. GM17]|uniref:TetR/AcrR family transcriptional regulator n=1 Tax=Pseudomonas sp. GM17 TaxID=1144323 RepID=UPI00027244C2|nr:TetR/AcrR family transcriptional regulator [Pseudomonas sp. GM17]WIE49821.1 TetR/AcrR family transcriptional regulator [Pseudomonas sp. GM17]